MHSLNVYRLARVLLAVVFIGLGIERVLVAAGLLPASGAGTSMGALAFGVFELVAGLLLAVGWQVRTIALVLAAFLLVDAFLSHPFWRFAAGEAQHGQLLHFLKNIAMIGGFVLLAWTTSAGSASASGASTPR
ncbi:MAG: DoxX family protein [Moraxellaceae bacterium]|nr:DoxX family protein [Moraxellaceae bacterium]